MEQLSQLEQVSQYLQVSEPEAGVMRTAIVIQNKRRDAAESFFQKGVRLYTILGL